MVVEMLVSSKCVWRIGNPSVIWRGERTRRLSTQTSLNQPKLVLPSIVLSDSEIEQVAQAVLVAFDEVANIPIPNNLERQAAFLMEIDVATAFGETQLDPRITAGIAALWSERSTREVVEQAASFQLNDSAAYVLLFI